MPGGADSNPIAAGGAPLEKRPVPSLGALFRATLWLGLIGFGGGVSVLGHIRHLAVERRRWLSEREFASTATVAQMLPGGAAANALAQIGMRFHGLPGAIAAYTGFIVPGAALTIALAFAYVRFGVAPRAEVVLAGLNAAVTGIVAALTLHMVRTSVARAWQMAVAAAALLLSFAGGAGSGEVALLGVGAGLVIDSGLKRMRLARFRELAGGGATPVALPDEGEPLRTPARRPHGDHPPGGDDPRLPPSRFLHALTPLWPVGVAAGAGGAVALGLLFLRAGLGAYGGGFAVVPHLHAATVGGGWISERDFASAVAVGKLTPGPVLLMASFIGYVAQGLPGALAATFTIFAAPFALVVTLATWLLRMRSHPVVRAALRGLTPAVVGLMGAAALTLGSTLRGPAEFGIASATALTLTRFQVNPALVLLVGGALRWALAFAGI
jgi:chromate transporter